MDKLGKFFVIIISGLFFSTIFHLFTVDYVLPKIKYENNIKFNLAYLNYNDVLKFIFKSRADSDFEVQRVNITKSNILQHYDFSIPFEYEPTLELMFGESNPISFAISNVAINNQLVNNELIIRELRNNGYLTTIHNNVIYAEPANADIGHLNLYNISNDFVNENPDIINQLVLEEKKLRNIYLSFLIVVFIVLFKLFCTYAKIKNIYFIFYSVFLFCALGISSLIGLYNKEILFDEYNFGILIKNHLFILVIPIAIYIFSFNKKNIIKFLSCLFSILFMVFWGIDHFVQVVFGTRFLYSYIGQFAGETVHGLPFVMDYIGNYQGLFYLLSIFSLVSLYLIHKEYIRIKLITHCIAFAVVIISISMVFFCNYSEDSKLFNNIQVNINGLFTDGDFRRPYVNYHPYSDEQLEYKTYKGLNQRKNVIVILVESLACDMTYLCGSTNDYSPYTTQLAKENIWFPNYYSNAFHTNGAIFAITTGHTLIYGDHKEDPMTNKLFYQHDLINKFTNAGYITAYYSPASLVINKNKQLEVSNYSYISSGDDEYYKNITRRGVFNSVSDDDLYSKILHDLEKEPFKPKFFMLTTISTHTPYLTPWSTHDIKQGYLYSDQVIHKFITALKKRNYFKNGIVILTGDHKGWGNNEQSFENTKNLSIEKLPLIMINGYDHGKILDHVAFSHTSLGIMLEYLMLSEYEKNKYQVNPLLDQTSEVVLHYNGQRPNNVIVRVGNNESEVLLDGDETRFEDDKFALSDQESMLGLISFTRQ